MSDQGADAPDLGRLPGRHHHTPPLAISDQGAGVGHAKAVARHGCGRDWRRCFLHRLRFAGQRRLFHPQRFGFQQPHIGRHLVSGCEQHDVARHQFLSRDFVPRAVTQYQRVRREHVADGFEGFFGLAFLDKADHRVDDHHACNHPGVDPMPERSSNQRRSKQHVDQHVMKLQQKTQQRPAPLWRLEAVRAVDFEAAPHLGFAQAALRDG